MSKTPVADTARAATTAVRKFKSSDPVVVAKTLQMKKVYFRRSDPKHELARLELAFDTEQYLAVTAALCLTAAVLWAARRCYIRLAYHGSGRKA